MPRWPVLLVPLLLPLAPLADAGLARSASCARLPATGVGPADVIAGALVTFDCTVVGEVGSVGQGFSCLQDTLEFANPTLQALWYASASFVCQTYAILV